MKKRVFAVLISVLLTAATLVLQASATATVSGTCGAEGENLTWTLDGEGTLTISGEGKMADYLTYKNHAPWYSYRNSIVAINIGEEVTSIGNAAFFGCNNLTSAIIPCSVETIGTHAFYGCTGLESIKISDGVITIGAAAFLNCQNLSNVVIGETVTTIGDEAFSGCTALAAVTIPNSVISIGNCAFNCTALVSIRIPDGVVSVGSNAFADSASLISVSIPRSVTSIGSGAFYWCPALEEISVNSENPRYSSDESGALYDELNASLICFPAGRSQTSYDIRNGMTSIGASAFLLCDTLEQITIPDSVVALEEMAFFDCGSLTEIVIPSSVTSIANMAFAYCTALGKVTFEGDAPTLGSGIFDVVAATVCYPQGNATWTSDVMQQYGGTLTWEAYVPATVVASGNCGAEGDNLVWTLDRDGVLTISGEGEMGTDYGWLSYSSEVICVVIEKGVTSIGDRAFAGCTNVVTVDISDSVVVISCPFMDCFQLTGIYVDDNNPCFFSDENGILYSKDMSVLICVPKAITGSISIPETVTCIFDYAFNNCTGITGDLFIPNGVTSIGVGAFSYCSGFTGNLIIPDSVVSIGSGAFSCCSGFDGDLIIPDSVVSIGSGAFRECSQLTGIWVDEGNPNYCSDDNGVLYSKDMTTLIQAPGAINGPITIPSGVVSVGDDAFSGCSGITGSLVIPAGVTYIGYAAFSGCSGFNGTLTIPDSVNFIGEHAFSSCSGFVGDLTIPENVTYLGWLTFYNCSGFNGTLTIPASVTYISDEVFEGCSGIERIRFCGNAPTFGFGLFKRVTAIAYYPADDPTWTEDVLQDYGGTVTWLPSGGTDIACTECTSRGTSVVITCNQEAADFIAGLIVLYDKNGQMLRCEMVTQQTGESASMTLAITYSEEELNQIGFIRVFAMNGETMEPLCENWSQEVDFSDATERGEVWAILPTTGAEGMIWTSDAMGGDHGG